jgi:hypothetical protein
MKPFRACSLYLYPEREENPNSRLGSALTSDTKGFPLLFTLQSVSMGGKTLSQRARNFLTLVAVRTPGVPIVDGQIWNVFPKE